MRELYPRCPPGREVIIAEHACLKYSGRVGRSASAKSFDEQAIRLAVLAHVRHAETRYDELLAGGIDRWDARAEVEEAAKRILAAWGSPGAIIGSVKKKGRAPGLLQRLDPSQGWRLACGGCYSVV